MARVTRIEILDDSGVSHSVTVDSKNHGVTGSMFFSLAHLEKAYAAHNTTNADVHAARPDLVNRLSVDGIVVHDEHCEWW